MAKIGNEFGSVTGRARRCGWLDLVALKYTCQINGVTELMMMKGDVLSGFDKIMVCTGYKYKGDIITQIFFRIFIKLIKIKQYVTMILENTHVDVV